MIHLEFKNIDITVTWRMMVLLVCVEFGIYLGGVTSGYLMNQAQYSQRAAARDKTVGEIKQKVDQIPDQTATKTADAVKQVVKDDGK